MYYYNQRDYGNISYPSSAHPKATISSGGCGVCSTTMVINNLAGKELYTIQTMRNLSISSGARVAEGTDVLKLIKAVAKEHKEFSVTTTNDETKLVKHLKNGGMAIANQGDAYNIFSSSGHFVVAYKLNGNNIEFLDPYMYSGKFDISPRPSRIVKKTTNGCVVTPSQLGKATQDRSPAYYLVTYVNPNAKSDTKPDKTTQSISTVSTAKTMYVKTSGSVLFVRNGRGESKTKIDELVNGTKVTVYATKDGWSKISKTEEKWVSSAYLTSTVPKTENKTTYKTSVGKSYRLKSKTNLWSKGDLTGTKYQYYAQTEIVVISHYSTKVDYVKCVKTGRKAYCPISAFI